MEIANITVALGGDAGNTVPKFNVTASEIAVIRSIHGNESVTDVEPLGEKKINHREERARLFETYGRAMDGNNNSIVAGLFPGAAARLFETLEELELPEEFYKTATRVETRAVKAAKVAAAEPEAPAQPAKKLTKAEQKAADKAAAEAATKAADGDEEEIDEEEDGISDMQDSKLFK